MRKALTMIELIFVIVIIGILASVAVFKLSSTRDDAEAAICINEVGQLIHEISNGYTKLGYLSYSTSQLSSIINVSTGNLSNKGIVEAGATVMVDGTSIHYKCDDKVIVTLTVDVEGKDYNLTVDLTEGTTPASKIASEGVKKNILNGATSKVFKL